MKAHIAQCLVPPGPREVYGVFVDGKEIQALVTHDPTMVKSWIGNIEHVNRCRLQRLIVGFDVEWRPMLLDTCYHRVATLQLCVGDSCLIFQIFHATRIPRKLREFLRDPDYTFVGVGIKSDVNKLWNDYGLEVAVTRDLRSCAADELDKKKLSRVGLIALVQEVLGEDLKKPKNITLSSWDNHSLSKDQVLYACLDAYFSFEIGRRLSAWY